MDVDEASSSTNAPTPHEILWYSDGSVVLSTDLYLFKVHKSFLSRHSSVFKDLFEFPNIDASSITENASAVNQETCEVLPLVALAGDRGEDVVHLLRAVYEPRYHDRFSDATPLHTVVALLLLSTKYDFMDIRSDVISQISRHYPMEFSDFTSTNKEDSPLFGKVRWECHIPLLVAAFRANADVLLPTLYFVCSGIPLERIFDSSSALPPDCLRILMLGREKLRKYTTMFAAYLPTYLGIEDRKNMCMKQNSCLPTTPSLPQSLHLVEMCFENQAESVLVEKYMKPACDACTVLVGNEIDRWRKIMWSHLSSYFELPEGTRLQDDLKKMMGS
ncbi:hypothetical protein SCHPADRAFT_994957 [Schizopora paradoxa]|uniref:BTB domain-containing protein n=1 Tax=Schizopora paradoxa TaxID=27342 RepID=A0A0H2RYH6_9AGAM|nr:hypothetical protein SCHPADRAFT_994957 [Schizopora paradoxa]